VKEIKDRELIMNYEIHPKILRQIATIKLYEPNQPYIYFATVTFQHYISEDEAKRFASTLIRRFNKKLLGRTYDRSEPLRGVAVMEKASIIRDDKKKDRGNFHFHFLIKTHPSLIGDPQDLLQRVENAFRSAALGLNLNETQRLVSKLGTDVKLIRDEHIYEYVTKEAWHPAWKQDERLFFLDSAGLV